MPYEKLKDLTRGRKVTMDDFRVFIEGLNISRELKNRLEAITPRNYTGLAKLLVESQ